MPLVSEAKFTAIDFESAGTARGATDQAVQIGMAQWSLSEGHAGPFVSYLQCSQPIQWSAQKVHGISTAHLAGAPSLLALWPEVKVRLQGRFVVAHGKGTERRFLRAFPGHGFGPWIDTLLLSRAAWPEWPDHSLGALSDRLMLDGKVRALVPGKNWHDALFDAVASLVLLEHLIESFGLHDLPADFLCHADTSGWHRGRRSGG